MNMKTHQMQFSRPRRSQASAIDPEIQMTERLKSITNSRLKSESCQGTSTWISLRMDVPSLIEDGTDSTVSEELGSDEKHAKQNSRGSDSKDDTGDEGSPGRNDDGLVGVVVVGDSESYSGGREGGHGGDGVEEESDELDKGGVRGEGAGVAVVRVRSRGGVGALQSRRVAFVRFADFFAVILLGRTREGGEAGHHRGEAAGWRESDGRAGAGGEEKESGDRASWGMR